MPIFEIRLNDEAASPIFAEASTPNDAERIFWDVMKNDDYYCDYIESLYPPKGNTISASAVPTPDDDALGSGVPILKDGWMDDIDLFREIHEFATGEPLIFPQGISYRPADHE